MDDDESIAKLMDLGGDGQIINDIDAPNPFQVINHQLPIKERIELNTSTQINRGKSKRMSLMQRAESLEPRLPPCVTRATRVLDTSMINRAKARTFLQTFPSPSTKRDDKNNNSNIETQSFSTNNTEISSIDTPIEKTSDSIIPKKRASSTIVSDPKSRPKHQPMTEFVQQKREVYLFQLFINRKKSEIQRFAREEYNQEKKLQEKEQKISEEIENYKMTTVQLEAALARQRHQAELAAQKHTTFVKNLRHSETNCSLIRSEISKNEDLLETYRPYMQFLKKFVPEGMDLFDFFKNPYTLIDEIHTIEEDNLKLIQYCQHFEEIFSNSSEKIDQKLFEYIENEKEIINRIKEIEVVENYKGSLSKKQRTEQENDETEFKHLSKIIRKTFINCFGVDADIGPLSMLERIENKLESMYNECDLVDPEFLLMKKSIKDMERREMQRKARNLKKEMEQQRKIEQAIERAKRPIPKRTGRPTLNRILPITIVKPDDELIKMKEYEIRKEKELLYGNIDP